MSLLGGHNVWFKYEKETIQVQQNNETVTVTRPVTTCTIQKEDNKIAESTVKLHHKDISNRIKAREYAFTSAVSSIKDRNVRKAIHEDFRANIKWQ